MNYEILLKEIEVPLPPPPLNRPAAGSHLRPVHCYTIVMYTLRLARLMIFMMVWLMTPF